MNNYKMLEYLTALYNKPLDLDNGEEYEKEKQLMISNKYFNLKEEYKYFNKICKEFNGVADYELLGFMIRRNILTENIVLWKTIYYMISLTDADLMNLGFTKEDVRKFRGIYNLVMNNVSIKKFGTLIREVRVSLKRRFKAGQYKYDNERLNNEDPYLIGVKDRKLYLALYSDDPDMEYKEASDYCINLYTGNIDKSTLVDKKIIIIRPGDIAMFNYETLYEYMNIRELDIFWV